MNRRHWVQSAITDDNGEIDVGNLGLFLLIALVVGAVPFACAMVLARAVLAAAWRVDFPFDVQSLGIAIGAICSGFATAIGGWGAARRLADNKGAIRESQSSTIVTTDGSVEKTTTATDAR